MFNNQKSIFNILLIFTISISASAENKSCLVCKFPMAQESEKSGETLPCDDLFGASCLGSDGKPKYNGASKDLPASLANQSRKSETKRLGKWVLKVLMMLLKKAQGIWY